MDPQRRLILQLGVSANAAALAGVLRAAVPGPAMSSALSANGASPVTNSNNDDGRGDFDFFHGQWKLQNRRLKNWLSGVKADDPDEWIEFAGVLHCQPILGGLGNIDELTADFGDGIHGLSLRLYQPATRQWSDYWASKRNGVLNPPVLGGFVDDVGTFHGDDEYEGRPVRVRAIWRQVNGAVHWEQAFSTDAGKTWETNWTMRMTRIG